MIKINKKWIGIFLSVTLICLTGCSTENTVSSSDEHEGNSSAAINSQAESSEDMVDSLNEDSNTTDVTYIDWTDDTICAVAYLGYDYADFIVQDKELYLPSDVACTTVEVGGDELYLVIPRSKQVTGEVFSLEFIGESAQMEIVENVHDISNGEAFIVRCNVSDIMPNVEIVLTDGEHSTTFSPYISLQDGSVVLGDFVQDITIPHEMDVVDRIIYISLDGGNTYDEVAVANVGELTPEFLIAQLADITGWNLDLADEVTSGKGGMTVSFAKTSSLFVGPPEEQKEAYFVFDAYQLSSAILDSIKHTLQYNFVDSNLGDPSTLDIYFCQEGDVELYLDSIDTTIPLTEPYTEFIYGTSELQ